MNKKEETQDVKPYLTNNTKKNESNNEYCKNNTDVESTDDSSDSATPHLDPSNDINVEMMKQLQIVIREDEHTDASKSNSIIDTSTDAQTYNALTFDQKLTPTYGNPAITMPFTFENTNMEKSLFNYNSFNTMNFTWSSGTSTKQKKKIAKQAALKSSLCFKQSKANSPTSTELKTIVPTFCTDLQNVKSLYVFGGHSTQASICTKPPQATMTAISENTALAENLFDKTTFSSIFDENGAWKLEISTKHDKLLKSFDFSSHKSLHSQKKLEINSPMANTESTVPKLCPAQQNETAFCVFGGQKSPTNIFNRKSMSECIADPPTENGIASADSFLNKTVLLTLFDITLDFGISMTPTSKFPMPNAAEMSHPFRYIFTRQARLELARSSYELQKMKIDLYKYKDYKSATGLFEDAILLCPEHVPFYAIKCHHYMKLGMYKEALENAQKIVEYDSDSTYGYICLAKCYLALGHIPGAVEGISKFRSPVDNSTGKVLCALQEIEQLLELYIEIHRAISLDDYTDALGCTDRFLELCPSNKVKATKATCFAMLGQFQQAIHIADECLKTDFADPEALYAKGLCYYYNGQLPQAVEFFKQVLAAFPLHWGAIDSLKKANKFISLSDEGVEALKEGDYDKVIMLNNTLLTYKLNTKTNLKLYCSNAAMYLKLNKIKLAIEACTAALNIDENCVDALRMRAKCYNKLGKYENSVKDLEKVGEVSKSVNKESGEDQKTLALNKEKTREMVSNVENLVENQKFKEALKLANSYLEDHKCDAELLYTKGLCYYYIGEYGKAREIFLQVLNIEPKHSKALQQLKKTSSLIRALECSDELFSSGRWQESLYEYKKALEIDIGNLNLIIRVHCKIADIYLQLDQIYKAIFECDHVLTFDNNCVEALNKRAECYTEVMKYESAVLDYEKICTIVDNEEIKQTIRNSIVTLQKKKHYRQISNHAKILMERQESELALKLAEECLQFNSSDTHALYVKGMCLYFKDQYDEALDQFQRLLLLKPCHSMALKTTEMILSLKRLIERANNSVLSGKWQDALNNYTEALTIDMCNKNLRVRLYCKTADMHLKLSQRPQAIEAYTNAVMLDENCLDALRERAKCYTEDQKYESAIEDYEKIFTIEVNEETKQYTRNCIIALKEKIDYKEKSEHAMTLIGSQNVEELQIALKLAEECLQFDSSDTNAYFVKGMYLYYKDEYEQALHQLQQVLILVPYHQTALTKIKEISLLKQIMEKANNSLQSGRWHDALDSFTEALAIDTCNKNLRIKLYCKIAEMHLKLHHRLRAIEAYTNAVMLDENCLDALRERAKCYAEDQKYESAIEDYEKIFTIGSEETKQYTRNCIIALKEKIAYREKSEHAMTLIENQKVEEMKIALKLAEECLQFNSSDTNARFVKGMYLYYKDEFEQALHQFQQVLILKPSHSTAFTITKEISLIKRIMEKANNSLQNCQWQDALDNFTEALTIDMCNKNLRVRLYCKIAEMHLKLSQRRQAIEAYTNAVMLDENCLDALRERAKCYTEDQRYLAALADYEKLSKIEESEETKQDTRNCIITLKQRIAYGEQSEHAMTLIESQKVEELEFALELALKLADECLQFNSSDTTARCVKGMYFYYKDQYEQALEQFQQVLLLKPSHSIALKQSEMIMQFIETLERGNYLLANGLWAEALNHYSEALTVGMCSKNLRVKLYCQMASMHLKLNQKLQAIEAYSNALMLDAEHIGALRERANCYADDHRYESAIADYETIFESVESEDIKQSAVNSIKTLKLKSEYLKKSQHAEILTRSKKTEDLELALKLAEECLQFDSSDTNALCVKGTCLYYKDEYEQALHQFQQVLLLDPSHSTALKEHKKITTLKLTIEEANNSVLTERWQDALDHFDKAMKIDKCNTKLRVKLLCKMAEMNLKLNNKPQAIEEYTNALMSDEKCLAALLGRAICYKEDQRFESAIKDYETINTYADNDEIKQVARNSITSLTERLAYKHKSQQARKLLWSENPEDQEYAFELAEECLQFDSSDTDALYVKGTLLYHQNQYQEAQNQFQQILHISPSNIPALDASKKLTWLQRTIEKGDDLFINDRWLEALDNYNTELKTYSYNESLNCKLHCQKAMIYYKLNLTPQAIEAYSAALELDKKCLGALCERARCYIEVNSYEDALEDYKKIFTLARNSKMKEWARNSIITTEEKIAYKGKSELAETLMRSQKTEKLERALKLVEECLQFNSSDTKALCVKGFCYYYMDEYDQALHQFQQVLLLDLSHSTALKEHKKITTLKLTIEEANNSVLTERWQDALDHFDKAINIDKCNTKLCVKLFCKMAEIYLKLNNKPQAIEEYTNALMSDEKCLAALLGRAICYKEDQRFESAIKDYETINTYADNEEIKQAARNSITSLTERLAYKQKSQQARKLLWSENTEDQESAFELAEECLQFDNSDIDALYVKGTLLYHQNQYQEAQNQFQQILHISPTNIPALDASKKLTWLQRTIEKGDDLFKNGRWLEALDNYDTELKTYSDNESLNCKLHCQKAMIYYKLNQTPQAIEAYSAALELDKKCLCALCERARCYIEVNSYEDALEDLKKIFTLARNSKMKEWARNSIITTEEKIAYKGKSELAETLMRSQKTEKLERALKLVEECLQFNSSDTKALCVKGFCYYYMGEYDQAIDQFQRVQRLKPFHSEPIAEENKIKLLKRALEESEKSLLTEKWHDALNSYREALMIGGDNKNLKVKLFCKIGNIYLKLNQKPRAVDEYTNALFIDMNCVEALRRRAQCLTDVGKYDKAVSDYIKLHSIEQCDQTKKLLEQAKSKYCYYTFIHEDIERGNKFYKQNKYTDALDVYKEVVERYPRYANFYCKTFSCYVKLSMLKEAFVDAKKAIALDIKCNEVTDGIAGCYLALGDLTGAQRAIVKASEAGIDCTADRHVLDSLQRNRGQTLKYIDEQSYDRAISCIDKFLVSSPFNSEAKLMKAECLVQLGKIDEALEIADECIRSDRSDMEAVFVKGKCLYHNDKLEQAMKYFKEVLRLSPDHSKALAAYKKAKLLDEKKTQGNNEFKKSQWSNALRLYEEALKIDATLLKINSRLHYNRAVVYEKLNQTQNAAEACIKALELDENYVKALTLRAKCFFELDEYDSAVDDYEQLLKLDPSDDEIERLLNKAKLSQEKKSKCKNYYDILGISKFATKPVITQAYKRLAMVHHPDRHMDRSEFERRRQKRRFQQIFEAYTVLSDPIQRSKYDASQKNVH